MIHPPLRCGRAGSRTNAGFTLVEVIVVIAVVLLLSGIAVPLISKYMDDARIGRAKAECNTLASAFTAFYRDIGRFPTRNSTGTENHLYVLFSGTATAPTASPWTTVPNFWTWYSSGRGDQMVNHLLTNTPGGQTAGAYATTGDLRWRGPYLSAAPLDPWGRPYVATIIGAFNGTATNNNYKRVFVLSAGPDGIFQTNNNVSRTTEITGDDVGVLINHR
jgi:general secretion pathway protein G